jgi:hypothetical protein
MLPRHQKKPWSIRHVLCWSLLYDETLQDAGSLIKRGRLRLSEGFIIRVHRFMDLYCSFQFSCTSCVLNQYRVTSMERHKAQHAILLYYQFLVLVLILIRNASFLPVSPYGPNTYLCLYKIESLLFSVPLVLAAKSFFFNQLMLR